MKTPTLLFFLLFAIPIAGNSQRNYFEFGLAYRYVQFEEANLSLSLIKSDQLRPHELDLNLRFPTRNNKLYYTMNFGWTRYDYLQTDQNILGLWTCEDLYVDAIDEEYHAFRFNPGAEYQVKKKKVAMEIGAGLYWYSAFAGKREDIHSITYYHHDSLTNSCVEDSIYLNSVLSKPTAQAVTIAGLSAHLRLTYEMQTGFIFWVAGSVNPGYSFNINYLTLSPGASVGVNFRIRPKERLNQG
jgi:hypothetical protein